MSEQEGGKDRATVAVVNAKIDTVLAKIDGNAALTAEGFKNLQAQIDGYSALPAQVNSQHEMIVLLQARMLAVEGNDAIQTSDAERRRQYRRVHLPSLLLSTLALAAAVLVPILYNS